MRQLSLPSFVLGFSLTQRLTVRAAEALCWGRLALAQLHDGQVQQSVRSGHKAFAISKETRNVWSQANSSIFLAQALLEAGAYEEALGITHQAIELVRLEPQQKLFSYILHLCKGGYCLARIP